MWVLIWCRNRSMLTIFNFSAHWQARSCALWNRRHGVLTEDLERRFTQCFTRFIAQSARSSSWCWRWTALEAHQWRLSKFDHFRSANWRRNCLLWKQLERDSCDWLHCEFSYDRNTIRALIRISEFPLIFRMVPWRNNIRAAKARFVWECTRIISSRRATMATFTFSTPRMMKLWTFVDHRRCNC